MPVTSVSGALDITQSVKPPRAAFVNYPLGHATGKPFQLDDQVSIVRAALGLLESASAAPTVLEMPNSYEDLQPGWESEAYRTAH